MGKPTYEEHLSMLKIHAPDEFLKIQKDENHNEHRRLEILDKTRSLVENIRSMVGKIDKEGGDAPVLGKMTDESIKQTTENIRKRYESPEVYIGEGNQMPYDIKALLEITDRLQEILGATRNGKNIGQLHHQIVSLEVKNMAQSAEIIKLYACIDAYRDYCGDDVLHADEYVKTKGEFVKTKQSAKIESLQKERDLLKLVIEAEETARVYEDGTGAADEALFHARNDLEKFYNGVK